MSWKVPRIWEGGECWIIGGGFSLVKQFEIPDSVIQQVMAGGTLRSYSPYLSVLHDRHVIGVNMAYQFGNWVDIVFFGDGGFYERNKNELRFYKGLKVTCSNRHNVRKWNPIKALTRARDHYGLTSTSSFVKWNMNSGGAAINLAVHTGVKRIFLLGYDMKSEGERTHWHVSYGRGPRNGYPPFQKHLRGFADIANDARGMGVEIINVSPGSAIDCFPKMTLKECLKLKK